MFLEFVHGAGGHYAESGYDTRLVVLSVVVALFASYAALQTAGRIPTAGPRMRTVWITAGSVVLGGGIWSMHFIGMLAHELPFPVDYDLDLTVGSLIVAVAMTWLGLAWVSRAGNHPGALLGAGITTGAGVVGMHYMGMEAMRMPARLLYEPWTFALSVVIALVAATAALAIARREVSIPAKLGASVVMAVAICGMHYTGMAAARFEPAQTIALGRLLFLEASAHAVHPQVIAVLVAVGAALVVTIIIASATIDKRFALSAAREAETLRLGSRRMSALLATGSDLIVVADVDHAIRDVVGPADLVAIARARPLVRMVVAEDRDRLRALFERVLTGGERTATEELRVDMGARGVRACDVKLRDLRDEAAVAALVVTFHDVEERAAVQAALAEARDLADAASRAKSRFISMMSHELRTPLAAVLGYADLMTARLHGPLGSEVYDGYVDEISRAGRRLISVVDAIIGLGRIDGGEERCELRSFDAQSAIRSVMRSAADRARRGGVRLDHVDDGPVEVLGDPRLAVRVLDYLIDNAIKFTEADGEVVLLVERREDGTGAITITDSGSGIPAESLDRVTDAFFQADDGLSRRFEGAGLGLTVAKALAELQGGRIEIESTYGFGTVARLVLPLSDDAGPDGPAGPDAEVEDALG
ncbi:MHYT domain-containing protein [Tistrella mobilis]